MLDLALYGTLFATLAIVGAGVWKVVRAKASGVWIGKSGRRVLRAEEPERFAKICRDHLAALSLPGAVMMAAIGLIILEVLALVTLRGR